DGSATQNDDGSTAVHLIPTRRSADPSNANLTYTVVGSPTHGTLTGSGGSRTYTPDANYNGTDSFTYKVTDRGDPDNCGAPSTSYNATKQSATKTTSTTVNPANDAPLA